MLESAEGYSSGGEGAGFLILNSEARKQIGEVVKKQSNPISRGILLRVSICICLWRPEEVASEGSATVLIFRAIGDVRLGRNESAYLCAGAATV